ncbi:MAG: branched-chain amino acid ABC transporter permease [Haloferacaceae archaeon]
MSDDDPHGDGGTAVDRSAASEEEGNLIDRLAGHRHRERVVALAAILGVLLFPFFLIDVLGALEGIVGVSLGGYIGLPTLVLVFGIVVIGYNILLGYTGLLSFGHAALFGTAAYAAALFSSNVVASPLLSVFVGAAAATLLAWPIGFLSIRRSGVYFAVLTLTFGQMLYYYAFGPGAWLTGGDNGYTPFQHVTQVSLLGSVPIDTPLPFLTLTRGSHPTLLYLLTATFAVLAVVVAHRIIKSPYGLIFRALGQNERRTQFVGLNVFRYKLMAFVISGVFAGVGGGLYALYKSGLTIHPNGTLYWIVSGDFVIMTAVGGVGSLVGPVFGAALFEYIRLVLSGITLFGAEIGSKWRLLLGLAFVLTVWFFPDGIYGVFGAIGRRIVDRFGDGRSGAETGGTAAEDAGGDD